MEGEGWRLGGRKECMEGGGMKEEVAEKKGADTLQITHYRCNCTVSDKFRERERERERDRKRE